jgi:SAM-dependent methyltransferase
MEIFFEIHSGLPREAPGDEASLARALGTVAGLPGRPRILDLGCGPGAQTVSLGRRTGGTVFGLDNHLPFLRGLASDIAALGLAGRIFAVAADMAAVPFKPGAFDLLWSEGAAYLLGIEKALRAWRPLLKPRGWLAFTEAVWLRPDPPKPVRDLWEEYPAITTVEANLALIGANGFEAAGHFALPEEAWWTHYYAPLEKRLAVLAEKYKDDPEALGVLASNQNEIDVFRAYPDYYGYESFVCRRTD